MLETGWRTYTLDIDGELVITHPFSNLSKPEKLSQTLGSELQLNFFRVTTLKLSSTLPWRENLFEQVNNLFVNIDKLRCPLLEVWV